MIVLLAFILGVVVGLKHEEIIEYVKNNLKGREKC